MDQKSQTIKTVSPKTRYAEAFVIINPRSQKSHKARKKLNRLLDNLGIEKHEIFTEEPYHATKIIAEIAKEPHPIFVISGDGTLFEITNGLLSATEKHAEMHIIPVPGGGANDFSLSVLPQGLKSIQKIITKNSEKTYVDILKMEVFLPNNEKREYHANGYLGFGSTAKGSHIINKKRPRNRISELIALRGIISTSFSATIDDKKDRLISLTFHNIPRMARYIRIKNASPFDGRFETLAIKPGHILNALARSVIFGANGVPNERTEIIFPDEDIWCQADGEVLAKIPAGSKVIVSIVHKALPILHHPRQKKNKSEF